MSASDKSQAVTDKSSAQPPVARKDGKSAETADTGDDAPAVNTHVVVVKGKSTHEILAQIDVFADLPVTHLREIAAIGSQEEYRKGETIFSEGDAGEQFYLILDGAVRISRFVPGMGEEALAVLRAGAYFGEMSLVDDATRSAAAIVHERCRLFVINRSDLQDLLFVDRDLAYELLWSFVRTLSRRLRATNDKMTFLATTNKF